ncbi:unnamed protein product, partial [Protopolystoma xenopodis]
MLDVLLIVKRYEYVNLFHTITDWYNAFLAMRWGHLPASRVKILFVDAHPAGSLDEVWDRLFPAGVWQIKSVRRPFVTGNKTEQYVFINQ